MSVGLIAGLLWLALNIWATHRVLAVPADKGVPRGMLIASIWIIPFLGALMAKGQTPPASAWKIPEPPAPAHDPAREPAPLVLPGAGDSAPFDMLAHLALAGEIPVLDWQALHVWAEQQGPAQTAAHATDTGRRAWLLHLRDAWLLHAQLQTTDEVYILSSLEPRVAQATARYVATARQRIAKVLGSLARFPPGERSVLLVLDDEDDYYRYLSIYYPERGEFAISSGVFIHAGCPHFVVKRSELDAIEPVIAHELTHSALSHLHLPRWLDEGLAVNTERRVAGTQPGLYTPQELHGMHRRYWNAARIQEFWSGASFLRTDDGNLLSYELARILVENFARQWDAFTQFVASAKANDAGAAAARGALSASLGASAAAVLEMGDGDGWEPVGA